MLEVDPDNKEKPLHLESMDVLPPNYDIQRVKQYNNGILQDIPDAPQREIQEFLLRKEACRSKQKVSIGTEIGKITEKM